MSDPLHEQIVDLIPSKDLQAAIRSTQFQLTDIALLATVYRCAPNFETKTEYLKKLEAAFSGELKAYTARIIETQQQMLEAFLRPEADVAYELHIKETPDAYDERYLCGSFEAAVKMISLYYREYGGSENTLSRCRLVKRRVFSANEGETFSEDHIGEMILLPGGIIRSVEMDGFCAEDCDGLCLDCERHCVRSLKIPFPCFTDHGDAVRYRQPDGSEHFGVVLQWDDAPTNECYIIPLDSEQLRHHDHMDAPYAHEHIPSMFVERIPPANLPEEMQDNYLAYLEFLKKTHI